MRAMTELAAPQHKSRWPEEAAVATPARPQLARAVDEEQPQAESPTVEAAEADARAVASASPPDPVHRVKTGKRIRVKKIPRRLNARRTR